MFRFLVVASMLALAHVAVGQTPAPAPTASAAQRIDIKVTSAGFEPREIHVKRGHPVVLAFTRVTDRTCITAIDIPDENVKGFELPLGRTVTLTITPAKKGLEPFHCSAMGMGKGRLVVED